MECTLMSYNESNYQKYYQECIDLLGGIRLKKLKFEHKLENTKIGDGIPVDSIEDINDSLMGAFIVPQQMREDENNIIDSINLTQQLLAASYSLLKIQLDEVELSKEQDGGPNYFWFVFYFEDTVNRIFTLNDLLWNFVNYYYDYNEKENNFLKGNVRKRLKKDNLNTLMDLLNLYDFKTNVIRNSSIHNSKPFLFKGMVTVKDGMIAVGQGSREFDLDKDMPKLEADIKYLSSKYKRFIEELKLEVL